LRTRKPWLGRLPVGAFGGGPGLRRGDDPVDALGSTDLEAIEAEIDQIRSLGLDALRARWRSIFGVVPPKGLTKDLIARMIAYRIQEEAFGGLDRATIKLLDGLVRGGKSAAEIKRRLKPGTVLVREYQGERHTVTVAPDGFVWRETTYASLSTIARAITGTAWNGPRFFGLRAAKTDKAAEASRRSTAKSNRPSRNSAPRDRGTDQPGTAP